MTTWLLSMVNAGWFPGADVPMVLAAAFAFGGTAQFVAGVAEGFVGNGFGFVAFCGYGAFWWSFALFVDFPASALAARSSAGICCSGVFSPLICGLPPGKKVAP